MDVDLNAAAAEGIISEDQATALRAFEARRGAESLSMAEKFHIFGGLSDLVAAAGLALTFVASGTILSNAGFPILYVALPAAALMLIRRVSPRHKPCVTIVLLTGSLVALGLAVPMQWQVSSPPNKIVFVVFGLIPALGYAWLIWRITRFPPLPAAMATIIVLGFAVGFTPEFAIADGNSFAALNIVLSVAGLGVLLLGVWWDLTDIRRETERSQVAFWLHCCAGFFITRGAYGLVTGQSALKENFALGLSGDDLIWFLLIFGLSLLVSLLLDRRSLMIGSIMPTITFFDNIASEIYGMLFAGASLLVFTYFWNSWRAGLLRHMPVLLAAQLPRTDVVHQGQRPTRRHHELMRRVWKGGS